MTVLLTFASVPTLAQGRVLDIENLRAVPAGRLPNAVPTCQVLIVGGGLGGVAAAETLASRNISVILTEPTSHLGGQLTAQGVSTPDENRWTETDPGTGTRRYRALREQVRAYYAKQPGIQDFRAFNVGDCWVSRISGEPRVWEQAIREDLAPYEGLHSSLTVLLRHQIVSVHRYPGNGQISYADFVNLDSRRITRIGAQYVLDASETGEALALAGSPTVIGQEAQSTYGEPDAPPVARPDWVQSLAYCFAVRWAPTGSTPTAALPIIPKPDDYEAFRARGQYTLDYDYSDERGRVTYKMLTGAPGAGGPFWTYRRLVAASSFTDNPAYAQDIALINWRGNDFREETPLGKPVDVQVRILKRAKAYAQGFLYWLQTECPRDDGHGAGYPEIQPASDVLGTDGFAPAPYVRESRRLLAQSTLTENDLTQGTAFLDSVGIALYPIDIHPANGEPPLLKIVQPYELPLGAFLPRSGPTNIIPAAKDLGATRLALASARMHPTEWLCGEIAAHLAAFCLIHAVSPSQVRSTPTLLTAFQADLRADGITTRWADVPPLPSRD